MQVSAMTIGGLAKHPSVQPDDLDFLRKTPETKIIREAASASNDLVVDQVAV